MTLDEERVWLQREDPLGKRYKIGGVIWTVGAIHWDGMEHHILCGRKNEALHWPLFVFATHAAPAK